ncbi:chaplin family protein [Streptomyces hirsutus]
MVQVPLHAPINACGNTGDVLGFLNPPWATAA